MSSTASATSAPRSRRQRHREEARHLFMALTGAVLDPPDPSVGPRPERRNPLHPPAEETGRRSGW